jgi:hypothetical protein
MRRTCLPALAVVSTVVAVTLFRPTPASAQGEAEVGTLAPDAAAPPPAPVTPGPVVPTTSTTQPAAADAPASAAVREGRPVQGENNGRFEFGSYGRISVASDLRGGTGRPTDIVAHGSRVDEASYSELELRREDTFANTIKTRIVTTIALFPEFFHFTGKAADNIGIRNLYVQANYKELTLWAGSRMYRGDDIYLLNWWPLDNQNTMGAGGIFKLGNDTIIAAHGGMQRLQNDWQFQQIPGVAPYGFGTVPVTTLDRPRTVQTLKITHFVRNSEGRLIFLSDKQGFKASLYGEAHQISSGVRRETNPDYENALPSDSGFLVGTQLAYWTGERDTYVSLFLRHARGLAAYDPLSSPTTFANSQTTSGTTENMIAIAGNWEKKWFGVMAAGYLRFFRDGSPNPTSREKYDEGIVLARPQIYIGDHWGIGLEASYQQRRYALLNQEQNANLSASLFRGAILPYFSPTGRGSFKRPQIGLVYAVTARDRVARSLYAAEDVFAIRKAEHFFGVLAEWWFNFSSYP